MNIGLALMGILISAAGLLLLSRKWNIATRANLVKAAVIAILAAAAFLWVYPLLSAAWLRALAVAAQVGLTFLITLGILYIRFWRDPERTPMEHEGVIVSSADGEVIYVKELPKNTLPLATKNGKDYLLHELMGTGFDTHKKGLIIIGIEMNITNVHVNRCPIKGDVKLVKHIPGKFLSLRRTDAPFLNTRCTTLISNGALTVASVQISSRLVRRVDNYLAPGQCVELGQRLGMIRFGSQVAVIFPNLEGIKVEAHVGQVTLAGVTVLARYSPEKLLQQLRKQNT